MSDTKFTKGPWVVANKGLCGDLFDIEFGDDGECIAEVVHEEYDAHLIAAAPDMHDLLVTIENDNNQVPAWLWDKIQCTLKKARGE